MNTEHTPMPFFEKALIESMEAISLGEPPIPFDRIIEIGIQAVGDHQDRHYSPRHEKRRGVL